MRLAEVLKIFSTIIIIFQLLNINQELTIENFSLFDLLNTIYMLDHTN